MPAGNLFESLSRYHERLASMHSQTLLDADLVSDLERRFREAFESFPLPVFYCDVWGKFLWTNRKAEEVSGYRREELIGELYYRMGLVGSEELLKVLKMLASSLLRSSGGVARFSLVRKDRGPVALDVAAHLVSFGNKKVLFCVASLPGPKGPG